MVERLQTSQRLLSKRPQKHPEFILANQVQQQLVRQAGKEEEQQDREEAAAAATERKERGRGRKNEDDHICTTNEK
jgi:hypothetical protein